MKLRNKKTGEIVEAESCNSTTGSIGIFYENNHGQLGSKDCFETLAELNEEWEDYKPKEPLVGERSQRAVLRAAARLSGTNIATVVRSNIAGLVVFDFRGQCRVELKDKSINVAKRGVYTITELCGEEEE